ncbi:hypothetical protein BKA60DRAFT_533784 [Fusarium oxysporum]|nr:hypothetical protein BKA60DRAFT_533784 [Fusarium oxysporum]
MSVLNNSLPSGRELVEVRRQLALQHAADRAFDSAVQRLPWLGGKHGQRVSENLANKDCFHEEYDNATLWAVALSNDAFEVHDDIRIRFNQIGGGSWARPLAIFPTWSYVLATNLGAFALSTPINDKYNSLGGPLGSLDFAVHDEQPINTTPGTFFKFQNGKTFWRSTPESISVSVNSVYNFSVDQIQCMSTRSRVSDTLFVTASITIFGRDPVIVTKELGDHGVGFTYPNIVLENIPLTEEEIAMFVYMIMNSGDSGVKSKVESMGRDLATKGAQIAGEKAAQAIEAEIAGKAGLAGAIAAVGTWLGRLLGTPALVVGNVIGELIDILITHCDGLVASATNTIARTDLKELIGLDGKSKKVYLGLS